MKIELYLLSSFEEYPHKHVCRRHWNFQWRGRRGKPFEGKLSTLKVRKETWGGLMKTPDGKLWKLDDEAYFYLNLLT